jgi:hypothetical protein
MVKAAELGSRGTPSASIEEVIALLKGADYLVDRQLATVLFLALRLAIRLAGAASEGDRVRIEENIFSRRYLIERPLRQSLEPAAVGARNKSSICYPR